MENWIRFLLPVAIILSSIVVSQKILQNSQNKIPKSGYFKTITNVTEDLVDGLVISDKNGVLSFSKQSGVWFLNGKKADREKINNLISILLDKEAANYQLISQNPDRFEELNVSSTSAKISLKSGAAEKLVVIVGNSSYPGNFIRPAKENNVYLTSQSLGAVSTTDRNNFYDQKTLKGTPE